MGKSVAEELSAFISGTRFADIPEDVRALARREATDATGVMVAGVDQPATKLLAGYLERTSRAGGATVAGRPQQVDAASAALANAVSAHVHDFDDTQMSASGDRLYGLLTHPSSSIWPAALAIAEECGASGENLLAAYVVGLEVACRICDAISPFHYIRGYHTTGTINVFGATAAACVILGLNAVETQNALGIAASCSAGLRVNFGSMTKSLHAGRAAEAGIFSARMAQAGFTSNPAALDGDAGFFKVTGADFLSSSPALLENPLWGYAEVANAGYDADRILGRLGRPFWIKEPGISIKPFPSVVLSHPSIAAMLTLVARNDVAPENIRAIRVHAPKSVVHVLYREPTTGTQGKFSVTFCLALAALRRRVVLADFSDETVQDPRIKDLVSKVELVVDPELEARGRQYIGSKIDLELTDGSVLSETSSSSYGGPSSPLAESEFLAKFESCTQAVLSPVASRDLYKCMMSFDQAANATELTSLLRPEQT